MVSYCIRGFGCWMLSGLFYCFLASFLSVLRDTRAGALRILERRERRQCRALDFGNS